MTESSRDRFVDVARELSSSIENTDETYACLQATLTELFKFKAFEGFSMVEEDVEYEGQPKEQWYIAFKAKESLSSLVKEDISEHFFSISASVAGDVSILLSDEFRLVMLDSIVADKEESHIARIEFNINGLSPAGAAAKAIAKIAASDALFSQAFEKYSNDNPDYITPVKYSPYNP